MHAYSLLMGALSLISFSISARDKEKVNKLITNKLEVKKNARFCGDVSIKGDLTVHGEINQPRNQFHGWWRNLTKGQGFSGFPELPSRYPQLIYIDASNIDDINVTSYEGSLFTTYVSPVTNELDERKAALVNDQVLAFEQNGSTTRTVNGITGTFPKDFNWYFVIQQGGEFDGLAAFVDNVVAQNELVPFSDRIILFEKLNFEPSVGDQIRPYGNGDNAFKNSNSRIFMFEQADDIVFGKNNPALSPAGQAERLLPRQERLALRDKIIQEGVARDPVDLYNINKSTKGSQTTTLLTLGTYPFVSFASKVTVSGLAGQWGERLNGTHQVVGVYNTDNENIDQQAPFYQVDNRIYHIVIQVDTQDLPTFDPEQHICPGGALISPSMVGPITENIEYREFIDALYFYIIKNVQQSNHSTLITFVESLGFSEADQIDARLAKPVLETWSDVSQAISGTIPFSDQEYRFKAWFGSTICPTYYLPFWEEFFNTQINEPFEELGIPGSDLEPEFFPDYAIGTLPIVGFNVPFENYLLPESRRWLYFRVQPDSAVTNEQHENVWTLAYDDTNALIPELRGYASVGPEGLNTGGQLGGSRLEGLMSPVPYGFSDDTIEEGFWSPFLDSGQDIPTAFQSGIIDPALVGGRKIGYLFLLLSNIRDQNFICLTTNFGNPELANSPDPELRKRQQYDGEAAVIAEMMRYFIVEQDVDAMIIDYRINGGGDYTASLLESFGGARSFVEPRGAFQNQDNRDPFLQRKQLEVFAGTTSENRSIVRLIDTVPYRDIRPDLTEERYPNAVFKDKPLIILTSQYAGSLGDLFPRAFVGEDLTGNIGNGVQVKIVGSIDGILDGAQGIELGPITSKYGSEFPDPETGEGVAPFEISGDEAEYTLTTGGVPSSTRLDPRTNYTQPVEGYIPVNSNLQGPLFLASNTGNPEIVQGALSTNVVDTVYFDFGYTGPGAAIDGTPFANGHWDNPPVGLDQVDGFPGQPMPDNPSSLRDSWLEEAIRVTRLCLGDDLSKATSISTEDRREKGRPSDVCKYRSAQFKDMNDVKKFLTLKKKIRK